MSITSCAFLALLVFSDICIASDAPSKNKSAETPKQEKKASAPERGTESNPLFIKAIPAEKSQDETNHQSYEHHEKPTLDRWLTGSTIALVFVTAILALFTAWLWSATRKLVIGAEETAQKQLRAYVSIMAASIQNFPDGPNIVSNVKFKNCGQTPAFDIEHVSGLGISEFPLKRDLWSAISTALDGSEFQRSKEILGPGCESNSIVSYKPELSFPEKKAIESGNGAFYVYGEIRYRDAFGKKRWTRFKYFTGGSIGVKGDKLAAYTDGNEAT